MSKLFQILAITSVALLLCILTADAATNSGQYEPQRSNPYYDTKYFKNKRIQETKNYYNNFYKNYNPNVPAAQARIIQQAQEPQHNGAYTYSYETENGIHAEERGIPLNAGYEDQSETVEGSYAYITPEGLRVGVKYTADANGFHPTITYDGVGAEEYSKLRAPADVVITHLH